MIKSKAVVHWSGGKDSALCLYRTLQEGKIDTIKLLTSISEDYQRISMHGVRVELLEQQVTQIGIPLQKMLLPESSDMERYNQKMYDTLSQLKDEGITTSIYGDIFLEDLKAYREKELERVGLKALFPLWNRSSNELIHEFLSLGFKTIVVCVNEKCLDKSFTGRIIDEQFIRDLPPAVDPCGENGEFHTFVFDGPLFRKPVSFVKGEIVYRTYGEGNFQTGFWFCDLLPLTSGDQN